MDLKKVAFYIVSILLVAFAGLVFAGEIKLDIASMAQTLNIVTSKEETVKIPKTHGIRLPKPSS